MPELRQARVLNFTRCYTYAHFYFHEDILHQVDILIQSLLPPPREPPLVGWDVSARPAQSVAWVAQRRQLTGHTDGVGG